MEMFDCPETVIIDNAAKFKRWVMAKRDAQKHSKHDIQANQNLGRFVDLTYDKHTGIITEVISELSIVHEIAEEEAIVHKSDDQLAIARLARSIAKLKAKDDYDNIQT